MHTPKSCVFVCPRHLPRPSSAIYCYLLTDLSVARFALSTREGTNALRAAQPCCQNQLQQSRALSYSFGFDGGGIGAGGFEDTWPVGHRNTGINVCPQVRMKMQARMGCAYGVCMAHVSERIAKRGFALYSCTTTTVTCTVVSKHVAVTEFNV